MSCNLSANHLEMIGKCFGVDPSQYISPSHSEQCQWVKESKADWMWFVVKPKSKIDISFFKTLLINGLFVLPHGSVAQMLGDQFGDESHSNPMIQRLIELETMEWISSRKTLK